MASESDSRALDSLYRISSLVSSTENPTEALRFIMDEVVRVLKPNGVSICLLNRDTRRLELEVAYGFPDDWNNMTLELGQGITGWVALHGVAKIVNDVREEPLYIAVRPEIRSEMAVPMEDAGTVIGVVVVDSERVNAFDSSALKILSLLTAEASRVVSRLLVDSATSYESQPIAVLGQFRQSHNESGRFYTYPPQFGHSRSANFRLSQLRSFLAECGG